MIDFTLNPALDLDTLAARFRSRGFVQIPEPFTAVTADRLHACLSQEVPWGFAWYDGEEGARFLRAAELQSMPASRMQELEQQIYRSARTGYQYAYNSYPMLDAHLEGWNEVPLLDAFLLMLNDTPMLEAIRRITGFDDIIKADAQATRYGPGQFLHQHVDHGMPGQVWRAAYIYNLTPSWHPNWGGYLQLLDEKGDISAGLIPRFNVLNLLAVPQPHMVSMVNAFAGAQRYAITGWFRSQ